jgi:hypothetical protein
MLLISFSARNPHASKLVRDYASLSVRELSVREQSLLIQAEGRRRECRLRPPPPIVDSGHRGDANDSPEWHYKTLRIERLATSGALAPLPVFNSQTLRVCRSSWPVEGKNMRTTTIIASIAFGLFIVISTAQSSLIDGQVMKVDEMPPAALGLDEFPEAAAPITKCTAPDECQQVRARRG